MGLYNFTYCGLNDQYEHRKNIDISFGSEFADDGITIDECVEMFADYLRAIGYVFKNIEVIKE